MSAMSDFDSALGDFMDSVNADTKEYVERNYTNLKWSDDINDPEGDFFPIKIYGGRKYIKLVTCRRKGEGNSVYCFVEFPSGRVLKADSWKAPSKLDRGVNIFEPSTYVDKKKHPGSGWLYK